MADKRIYIRTDKNGTKIYHNYTCQRCGGQGGLDQWQFTGWTCFECGGTGERANPLVEKEYTEEYRAILDERARKRAEKRRAEQVAKFNENRLAIAEKAGFNSEGKLYVVIGNTYEIKDELKEAGAWFKYGLGWYFFDKQDKYPTIEMDYTECLNIYEEYGTMDWKMWKEVKEAVEAKLPKDTDPSKYVGEIGDRVTATVTLERRYSYETQSFRGFGVDTHYIYTFRDEQGNCLVWKSTAFIEAREGDTLALKGTVKAHEEYRGVKQTQLQRCKVEGLK